MKFEACICPCICLLFNVHTQPHMAKGFPFSVFIHSYLSQFSTDLHDSCTEGKLRQWGIHACQKVDHIWRATNGATICGARLIDAYIHNASRPSGFHSLFSSIHMSVSSQPICTILVLKESLDNGKSTHVKKLTIHRAPPTARPSAAHYNLGD